MFSCKQVLGTMSGPPPPPPPTSCWERFKIWLSIRFGRRERTTPTLPTRGVAPPVRDIPTVNRELRVMTPGVTATLLRFRDGILTTGQAAVRFYACRPSSFDGQPHPTRVRDWLHNIEYMMRVCDIASEEWVMLAASMLEGDARLFWEAFTEHEIASMSWEEFRH